MCWNMGGFICRPPIHVLKIEMVHNFMISEDAVPSVKYRWVASNDCLFTSGLA